MKNLTPSIAKEDVVRSWHLVDLKGKVLGREAVKIAQLLMGKSKPYFVKNQDCGDYVVVLNAASAILTGKKEAEKTYTQYSGYPGGMKRKPAWKVREEHPEELIRRAVMGMLPKNSLRRRMITRLYISADDTNKFADKFAK